MTEPISLSIATGVASELLAEIISSCSRKVQKRFQPDPVKKAINTALEEAITVALDALPDNLYGSTQFYIDHMTQFLKNEEVAVELAMLLDPSQTVDVETLYAAYQAVIPEPYTPDDIPDFDFNQFVCTLAHAFCRAVEQTQTAELQTIIQTGQLKKQIQLLQENNQLQTQLVKAAEASTDHLASMLVGQQDSQQLHEAVKQAVESGFAQTILLLEGLNNHLLKSGVETRIDADGTIHLETRQSDIEATLLTDLKKEILTLRQALHTNPLSPEDIQLLETRYRQHIIRWFERLSFQGMMSTAKALSVPLEDVYVDLRAVAEVPEEADTFSIEERRLLLDLNEDDPKAKQELLKQLDALRRERWSNTLPERKSIIEAVYTNKKNAFVILGDPGSGKTTLLRFLALIHAQGEQTVQEKFAQLEIPTKESQRLPIFASLAAFDDMLSETPNLTLFDFLAQYYDRRRGLPSLKPLFQQAMASGQALILLDGLDEVLTTGTRNYVAQQVTALIGEWSQRGVRFVLTSRFVGYREAPIPQVPHLSVLDFRLQEIKVFLHRWAYAYEKWVAGGGQETPEILRQAQRTEKALLRDVQSNASVQRLAANPLMLTMLALLRRQRGMALPKRRISLYKHYVNTLVESWIENRSVGASEQSRQIVDLHDAERIFMPLALWLQREKPSGTASEAEVLHKLTDIYLAEEGYTRPEATRPQMREAEKQAKQFLDDIRETTGLLIERGQNAFGFLHLTFQEYFAGRALARLDDKTRWQTMQPYLHDPRWREPILLCAGWLGVEEQRDRQVSELVHCILTHDDETEADLHRNLFLALAIADDDVNLQSKTVGQLIGHASKHMSTTQVHAVAVALVQHLARQLLNQVELPPDIFDPVLVDSKDISLRASIIEALASFSPDKQIVHILLPLLNDDNSDVREVVGKTLTDLVQEDKDVKKAFLNQLNDYENLTEAAVIALSRLVREDEGLREVFINQLNDDNEMVRFVSVFILSQSVDKDTRLKDVFLSKLDDNDWEIRQIVVNALVSLVQDDAHVREALLNQIDDNDWEIRQTVGSVDI